MWTSHQQGKGQLKKGRRENHSTDFGNQRLVGKLLFWCTHSGCFNQAKKLMVGIWAWTSAWAATSKLFFHHGTPWFRRVKTLYNYSGHSRSARKYSEVAKSKEIVHQLQQGPTLWQKAHVAKFQAGPLSCCIAFRRCVVKVPRKLRSFSTILAFQSLILTHISRCYGGFVCIISYVAIDVTKYGAACVVSAQKFENQNTVWVGNECSCGGGW